MPKQMKMREEEAPTRKASAWVELSGVDKAPERKRRSQAELYQKIEEALPYLEEIPGTVRAMKRLTTQAASRIEIATEPVAGSLAALRHEVREIGRAMREFTEFMAPCDIAPAIPEADDPLRRVTEAADRFMAMADRIDALAQRSIERREAERLAQAAAESESAEPPNDPFECLEEEPAEEKRLGLWASFKAWRKLRRSGAGDPQSSEEPDYGPAESEGGLEYLDCGALEEEKLSDSPKPWAQLGRYLLCLILGFLLGGLVVATAVNAVLLPL